MPDVFNTRNRDQIVALAAKYGVPAIDINPTHFVDSGGLIGYSDDYEEQCRLAAGYIDRILKGEQAGDLPVQNRRKYQLDYQPQDREGARPDNSASIVRSCRRGDRIKPRCLLLAQSGHCRALNCAAGRTARSAPNRSRSRQGRLPARYWARQSRRSTRRSHAE